MLETGVLTLVDEILFTVLTTSGVLATVLLLVILLRYRSQYQSKPIYLNFVSTSISCLFYLFSNVVVLIPYTFSRHYINSSLLLTILSTPNTIGYYTYQSVILFVSINKFGIFYSSICSNITRRQTLLVLALTWVTIVSMIICSSMTGFRKYFSVETYSFTYTPHDAWDFTFSFFAIATTVLNALISIILLYRISRLQRHSRDSGREISMFIQFVVVSFFGWLSAFSFFCLPEMVSWDVLTLSTIKSVTSTLSLTSNSFVMVIFNTQVKRDIWRLLGRDCRGQTSEGTVASRAAPATTQPPRERTVVHAI